MFLFREMAVPPVRDDAYILTEDIEPESVRAGRNYNCFCFSFYMKKIKKRDTHPVLSKKRQNFRI